MIGEPTATEASSGPGVRLLDVAAGALSVQGRG